MYGKNVKIITKLIISNAAFLLPMGLMAFLIISGMQHAIQQDRKEFQGVDTLRSAVSLTRIVPQYVRISLGSESGDREAVRRAAADKVGELSEKYAAYFHAEPQLFSLDTLSENWELLSGGGTRDLILPSYMQFMNDLYKLILYTGDISGLVIIGAPVISAEAFAVLNETAVSITNDAYRLQDESLSRLEVLIMEKIEQHRRKLTLSLIYTAAAVLIAFAVIVLTAASIRGSTKKIRRVFERLEQNDLSVSYSGGTKDELGQIMTALDTFLEKLKTAFESFSQNASMVSIAVYDLSSSTREITAAANDQSASVAEIVSTMENNKDLSGQVSSKTAEVAKLAEQTREFSRHGADLHETNEDMMLDIKDQNAKIIDEIKNLADMISRIEESAQMIDTIADQTKLIAFNAALEASSSGEAGARFGVVAGEIRRFADNVAESAAEIKEKITEVRDASAALISEANDGSNVIDEGYSRMVEQKEVFEQIVNASQNVAIRSQQISGLSKQQEMASAQIFIALQEISTGVKQFVTATESTSFTADNLNSMSIKLKEILAQYRFSGQENLK